MQDSQKRHPLFLEDTLWHNTPPNATAHFDIV